MFDTAECYGTADAPHANERLVGETVRSQIPEDETGLPMVFLHGYGQSRHRSKSVHIYEEGLEKAKELLVKYGIVDWEV